MALPVLKSVVGIGLETTYGVAAPANGWIPINGAPKPADKVKMDEDKSWRGSMGIDSGMVAGVYTTDYAYDSYVYPDTVGWALAGVLGDVAYTGGTAAGTPTTTTAALTAGTSAVVAVTSATGITAGTVLAIDTGALLELATVLSVAGLNVTLTRPVQLSHASGVAVQPVTGPFTNTFALYNGTNGQPPSYTITDWYSVNGRQYPGQVFSDASFKISGDGLLSYNATAMGLPSASLAGVAPQAAYSSVKPLTGWQGAASIAGVPVSNLLAFDVGIKRKVSPIAPVNGQQGPSSIFGADVQVTGKLDVVMNDDSQLLAYINNSQPALDVNYQVGSGATATQVKWHLSQAGYTAATIDRSKEYVQLSITFTAIFNPADAGISGGTSPIKVTVQNSVPPRTYK